MKTVDRRKSIEPPTASMGDIAFLLIIFFILASEFAKDPVTQVKLPKTSDIKKVKDKVPPISVVIDKEGRLILDGEGQGAPNEFDLDKLKKALQDKLSKRFPDRFNKDGPIEHVAVNASASSAKAPQESKIMDATKKNVASELDPEVLFKCDMNMMVHQFRPVLGTIAECGASMLMVGDISEKSSKP